MCRMFRSIAMLCCAMHSLLLNYSSDSSTQTNCFLALLIFYAFIPWIKAGNAASRRTWLILTVFIREGIKHRIYQVEILVQQNSEDLPHVSVPLNNNEGGNRPVSGQIYTYSDCIAYIHVEGPDSYCKMESLPLKLRQGQDWRAWNVVFKIQFNKQL